MEYCPICINFTDIIQKNVQDREKLSLKGFYKCQHCGYQQEIEKHKLIIKKSKQSATLSLEKPQYKNMIYDETLPRSKNYICPNGNCKSHQPKYQTEKEMVWFKPKMNDYTNIYVCCLCQTVW